jgi:hypothetical protein
VIPRAVVTSVVTSGIVHDSPPREGADVPFCPVPSRQDRHVHCYIRLAPGEAAAWCATDDTVPDPFDVGDRITAPDGRTFEAYPTMEDNRLTVARDGLGAAIAVYVDDAHVPTGHRLVGATA